MYLQDALSPPLANAIRAALTGALSGRLPPGAVAFVVDVVVWLVIALVIIGVVQIAMLYATWVERKVVGRIQDRLGANRAGTFGLLQPFADMIKMLVKEDITPSGAHRWVYNLAPILVVPPAIVVFAVIPVGIGLIATDLSVGFLFFTAIGATAVIPIFMAGWGSRNKYALLGAVRAVAQIVSYEVPQVLAIVGVLLLAGTLSTQGIVSAQGPLPVPGHGTFPGVWFVLLQPVAFVIYMLATAAEIERTPFDIPEAESEIIAGYHTEYAGIKFGMFYLAIYFMTLAVSALGTVLFLGGWQPPVAPLAFIPGFIWFALKTLALVLVFMWLRGTLPRLRIDQMMAFCWKLLVPLSLANLVVAALVGKLTQQGAATPVVVFFGFTLSNVILLAVTVWLVARWRGQARARELRFGVPPVAEGAV
jgi:NADH-quinone oxidoreductase subunit H